MEDEDEDVVHGVYMHYYMQTGREEEELQGWGTVATGGCKEFFNRRVGDSGGTKQFPAEATARTPAAKKKKKKKKMSKTKGEAPGLLLLRRR